MLKFASNYKKDSTTTIIKILSICTKDGETETRFNEKIISVSKDVKLVLDFCFIYGLGG